MKQCNASNWLLLLVIGLLFCGCQQLLDEENIPSTDNGTLKVRARSAESAEIIYPVHLYVFSENGECTASQTIEEEAEKMEFQLAAGSYRIVAVAGISDDYVLPENPDLDDVIFLDAVTGADLPLMTGKADVTIGAETKATLEITLTYAVTAVNVSLFNVPDEVKAVSMFLSPFYTTLSMNGVYGGDEESLELICSMDSENVWRSETRYVLPGSATETIFSIVMKEENGEETTYGYTWKGAMKANHPFLISGNYSGGITIGGSLIVEGWETATEVEFDFGSTGTTDNENNEGDKTEVDLSALPKVGEIWNGAIVANIVVTEAEAEILLLSLDEWVATTSQITEITDSYQSNNLSDWRLPNYEEAKMLRENFNDSSLQELNELIAEYDNELYGIDSEERYLCDKSGVYYSFIYAEGTSITQAGSKRTYYVRLVKNYNVNLHSKEG